LCSGHFHASFRHLDGELREILQQEINDFLLMAGLPRPFASTSTAARISSREFMRKTRIEGDGGKADAS
jgi:hypothetical protein